MATQGPAAPSPTVPRSRQNRRDVGTVVDIESGQVWLQSLLLGTVQITIALAVNALIVIAAGAIAGLRDPA